MDGIGANEWMSTTSLVQTSFAGWLADCLNDMTGWVLLVSKQAPPANPCNARLEGSWAGEQL